MLKVSIDEKRLRRSLEKAAADFGDTTAQGVSRLAVQFAREQATSSQAFGAGQDAKKQQHNAIEAGVNQVVMKLTRPRVRGGFVQGTTRNGSRIRLPLHRWITSAGELDDWVEQNRTRRRGRTASVPANKMPAAPAKVIRSVVTARKRKAGIAKGGWLGAGREAAKFQRGGKRLTIGKNVISWAQRHSGFGSARRGGTSFNPHISLHNKARHSSSPHVMPSGHTAKNMTWAARKTLRWYERALERKFK